MVVLPLWHNSTNQRSRCATVKGWVNSASTRSAFLQRDRQVPVGYGRLSEAPSRWRSVEWCVWGRVAVLCCEGGGLKITPPVAQ